MNISRDTALTYATKFCYIELVKLLLNHPPIDLTTKDLYGFTVLKAMKETTKYVDLYSKLSKIIKILEEADTKNNR